jgi:hypothetical protein
VSIHMSLTCYSCFLVEFYFQLNEFLYEVNNFNFAGCDVLSWSHQIGVGKSGRSSRQRA